MPTPEVKVEAGSTDVSGDSLSGRVIRPENAVSRLHLVANDYEGETFLNTLDAFTVVKLSFRQDGGTWTQVFEGKVESIGPVLDPAKGQTALATVYGYGRALRATHCAVDYGVESTNSNIKTPYQVWSDIITNRVNKNFDGNSTGYTILTTKIKNVTSPNIQYLKGGYRKNIDLINEVCLCHQAYRAGSAGVHWFLSRNKYLFIDTIANHTVDTTNWPTWWRTDAAGSTLEQGVDFTQNAFTKNVQNFANKIVLTTDLRKPSYDYWTEDSGGASLWGQDHCVVSNDNTAGFVVVGSHSLRINMNDATYGYAYYPSGEDAGWDFTKIGSEESIPYLKFYFQKDANLAEATSYIRLFKTDRATDYYYVSFSTWTDPDDEWIHRSIPIGPYWKSAEESKRFRWSTSGSPDWATVNGIAFGIDGSVDADLWLDDLHITGKIVREAYNSTSIAANDEVQKIVRMETSVNDTLKAADDTGTAAQLAYAELLVAQQTPIVGQVTIPLAEDVLPGQLVHCHSDKKRDGTFRVDSNFRVQQITHEFGNRFSTTLDLTDDMVNTFAKGNAATPAANLSALAKIMFTDPEAKSLKTTGIDTLVERLSKDYP